QLMVRAVVDQHHLSGKLGADETHDRRDAGVPRAQDDHLHAPPPPDDKKMVKAATNIVTTFTIILHVRPRRDNAIHFICPTVATTKAFFPFLFLSTRSSPRRPRPPRR